MPRIGARTTAVIDGVVRAGAKMQCYYWPIKGAGPQLLGYATEFDTDEKWVEIYIPGVKEGQVMSADGNLQKARLYINYDIRDKLTGETLYTVRQ